MRWIYGSHTNLAFITALIITFNHTLDIFKGQSQP